jgi:hypothetical protein
MAFLCRWLALTHIGSQAGREGKYILIANQRRRKGK